MAKKGKIEEILEEALKILGENPKGLSFTLLRDKIDSLSKYNFNTIRGAIWNLDDQFPGKVIKPRRGLFQLKEHADEDAEVKSKQPAKGKKEQPARKKIAEERFYQPFADYLEDEDECTETISLKGRNFGGKWRTPDVFGTYKFSKKSALSVQPQIVSAEIKVSTTPSQIIEGFGQACAYKVFSHKVYLVIPDSARIVEHIQALCFQFGIGLVLFDNQNPDKPGWKIRNSATVSEPDYFHVNQIIDNFDDKLTDKLF